MPSKKSTSSRSAKLKNAKAPAVRSRPTKSKMNNSSQRPAGVPLSVSKAMLFDLSVTASNEFPGILTLAQHQASLNGTLLLMDGVSDVAQAIWSAADALEQQGFTSGQPIIVTGRNAVVHFNDHPLAVIIMTNARAQ